MKPQIMNNSQIQKIEHRLKAAYNTRASYEVSDQWQQGAMRRIRKIGPLTSQINYLSSFEHFVWRLAPATCFLIFVMGTLIAHFGLIQETQLVNLILDKSKEAFSLSYMMGMG